MARILFIQCTEPAGYPPLINAAHCFAAAGHESVFLSAPIAGNTMAMPIHPAIRVVSMPERPSHVLGKPFFLHYLSRAATLARELKPALIYASDPTATLPGVLASVVSGAPLVYHEHDSPSDAHLSRILRYGRRLALKRATRIVYPNAGRADWIARETGFERSRLVVIPNVPRREEVPASSRLPDRPLVLYYHGNISNDLLPLGVIDAVLRFRGAVVLRFAGYETASGRGHSEALRLRAREAGYPETVIGLGTYSRHELLAVARESHIGIATMPPDSADLNMQHMTGASNKAFDYLAAGLGLLVSDLPDWREMFMAPGLARACDPRDVDSIAAQIRWFLDHPAERAAMGAAGRARILADWNYETAFAPLQRALGLGDPLHPQA